MTSNSPHHGQANREHSLGREHEHTFPTGSKKSKESTRSDLFAFVGLRGSGKSTAIREIFGISLPEHQSENPEYCGLILQNDDTRENVVLLECPGLVSYASPNENTNIFSPLTTFLENNSVTPKYVFITAKLNDDRIVGQHSEFLQALLTISKMKQLSTESARQNFVLVYTNGDRPYLKDTDLSPKINAYEEILEKVLKTKPLHRIVLHRETLNSPSMEAFSNQNWKLLKIQKFQDISELTAIMSLSENFQKDEIARNNLQDDVGKTRVNNSTSPSHENGGDAKKPNERVVKEKYILLVQYSGAGESNKFIGQPDCKSTNKPNHSASSTQSIKQYQKVMARESSSVNKILTVVDTPDFGIVESNCKNESQILCTMLSTLRKQSSSKKRYPKAVLLVIDFIDIRKQDVLSYFIKLPGILNHLIKYDLVDANQIACNLIIVYKSVAFQQEKLYKSPEETIRLIQGLIKTFTPISFDIPFLMAENHVSSFSLAKNTKGSYELPSGELYPLHVFQSLQKVINKVGNETFDEIIKNVAKVSTSFSNKLDREEQIHARTEITSPDFDILKHNEIKIPKTELNKKLHTEWLKLSLSGSNNVVALHIAKSVFSRAKIDCVSKFPQSTEEKLQLIRQLPIDSTLSKILDNVGIRTPSLVDHNAIVGVIYDVRNDVVSKDSPFPIDDLATTHSGFRAPTTMQVEFISNEMLKSHVVVITHYGMHEYLLTRTAQLHIEKEYESVRYVDAVPVLGHNIIQYNETPRQITGIREFREYSAFLRKNATFSPRYLATLNKLRTNENNKKNKRVCNFREGIHVIKFAFIGGAVSITATPHLQTGRLESTDGVIEHIKAILENIDMVHANHKLQMINGWKFKLKFHGGDPNKDRPRFDDLFSQSGSKLFNEWRQSIKLYPTLLLSELQLEHISVYLNKQNPELLKAVSVAANDTFGYDKDFEKFEKQRMLVEFMRKCSPT